MKNKLKDICNKLVFKKIYDKYADEIQNYLFFRFRDLTTCEDVLQEVFLKLWKNCDKVNYDKVRSYLFTAAKNTFIDIKKHEKIVREYQKKPVADRTNENPEFLLIEEEFKQQVEKAINALSEKQKEVFVMRKIEKLKYKQIAEKLGISEKAVEKRLKMATDNFLNALEKFQGRD